MVVVSWSPNLLQLIVSSVHIALLVVLVVVVQTGVPTEALISRLLFGSDVCFFLHLSYFCLCLDDSGDHLLQGNASFHNWVADVLLIRNNNSTPVRDVCRGSVAY